jgi:ABC-type bacteriocin/lantibiotic exporter with double-glycine peptidase domain
MPPLLRVEHALQEEELGCLAACVQMVLQYRGIRRSQRELNHLLGLMSTGTPASRVQRLERFGVTVFYGTGNESALHRAIGQGIPPVVFLFTGELPYWNMNLRHAVVVVGYTDDHVFLNDPAFVDSPKQVSWGDFLLAWSEFDYRYALITQM